MPKTPELSPNQIQLDLREQPVADFAVRVATRLDFPVKRFISEHPHDIHSENYIPKEDRKDSEQEQIEQ